MLLVFPTIHKLEVLAKYATAEEALAAAREANVEPILPAGGRERRRAAHLAAGRLGLLALTAAGRRSSVKRNPSSASHEKLSGCTSPSLASTTTSRPSNDFAIPSSTNTRTPSSVATSSSFGPAR